MAFAHFVQLRHLEVCYNSKVSCICNCKGKIVCIIQHILCGGLVRLWGSMQYK